MERKGESKVGRISLILSIIALVAVASKFAIFILGLFLPGLTYYFGLSSSFSLFLISIIVILASFSSLCFGLAGIFQKNRVRKFAFIGTIISVALLCIYILVVPIILFI